MVIFVCGCDCSDWLVLHYAYYARPLDNNNRNYNVCPQIIHQIHQLPNELCR